MTYYNNFINQIPFLLASPQPIISPYGETIGDLSFPSITSNWMFTARHPLSFIERLGFSYLEMSDRYVHQYILNKYVSSRSLICFIYYFIQHWHWYYWSYWIVNIWNSIFICLIHLLLLIRYDNFYFLEWTHNAGKRTYVIQICPHFMN